MNIGRSIKPVLAEDLRKGTIYLSLCYLDEQLLVPVMETLVFLGSDIFGERDGLFYFQRAESYFEHGEFVPIMIEHNERLVAAAPDGLSNIFAVPDGSDALALCAERWRQRGQTK